MSLHDLQEWKNSGQIWRMHVPQKLRKIQKWQLRKASAQVVATPVKKLPVGSPVSPANNPTAYAAKMAKNIPAQVDNMTSKMKKNMMPPVKNAKAKRVNIPA